MKLFGLLGAAMALACITAFASPAAAAVSPTTIVPFEIVQPGQDHDCLGSFAPSATMLFVEAKSGCDAVMADLTGLCLVPAPASTLPGRIAAVLAPDLDLTCTHIRPSPPG